MNANNNNIYAMVIVRYRKYIGINQTYFNIFLHDVHFRVDVVDPKVLDVGGESLVQPQVIPPLTKAIEFA